MAATPALFSPGLPRGVTRLARLPKSKHKSTHCSGPTSSYLVRVTDDKTLGLGRPHAAQPEHGCLFPLWNIPGAGAHWVSLPCLAPVPPPGRCRTPVSRYAAPRAPRGRPQGRGEANRHQGAWRPPLRAGPVASGRHTEHGVPASYGMGTPWLRVRHASLWLPQGETLES